ncbi:uncharacterized protein LOC115981285 [Quercus lobata]|uniref:uncharacterized protein LOC115981285 n=1 Tax=Quercus lobata TaxID=97700 RepID=UPI001248DC95|nr:uncharacterized protein LOC115981285 [Quercus lobata]
MKVGETLHNSASRYWELYNEIGKGNEKIKASTFRMGSPEDSELRESLTRKPLKDMRQFMRHIKEYKCLEDDRLQSKGKALLMNHPWQGGFQSRPRKDLRIQDSEIQIREVNVTFKEPIQDRRPDQERNVFPMGEKDGGDKGHTTEQYRVLKDHLGQLVKAGYLKEFVVDSGNRGTEQGAQQRGNPLPPPLGVIEVIYAASRGTTVTKGRGVLTVVPIEDCLGVQPSEKRMKFARKPIAFNDNDLEGTI